MIVSELLLRFLSKNRSINNRRLQRRSREESGVTFFAFQCRWCMLWY
ncbi:hypothetical protein glysoja_020018 [Glycine soja]|nr:hypothetical protein glysoja_020018 [Glycine soja]